MESNKELRDDLNPDILKEISDLGWTYNEVKRPGDPRTFDKNNTHVWLCIHRDNIMWARADIINDHYKNHMYYGELLDAIKDINGIK